MPFSALPSQSLSSHCLSFSFSPLLLDLTKTTHELPSRHSAPPKVKPNSTEKKKKTAVQLHKESSPWLNAGLSHFHSLDRGESFGEWWWTRWTDLLRCRRKKKKKEGKDNASHIVILGRKKGGREEIREANGVPHPLGRCVEVYFLRSNGGLGIHFTYTQCMSALNWLWTGAASSFI